MEKVAALTERIKALKAIAASMHEGAIHTQLIPEIDKVLALPDELATASVGEREAVARQVREYEQTFDKLGYSLLDQIMPTTGVSAIFRVVQAADEFKAEMKKRLGRNFKIGDKEVALAPHHLQVMSRYGLSIGTPPVTAGMRELVSHILFGKDIIDLLDYSETLACDPVCVQQLLSLLGELVSSSLHYNTADEERAFLREALGFINFEGGSLFNQVVVTESPERVIELIRRHVFDKFGPHESNAVRLVEEPDKLDPELIAAMQRSPNQVFVARVTRIPHKLFTGPNGEAWRSVLGRLILIDDSARARLSNTTIVYTLFPHVARTLRNVQNCFAGRPANTQLQLRRILERFSPEALAHVRQAIEKRMAFLEKERAFAPTVEELRAQEWKRTRFFGFLTLMKLKRMVSFLETLSVAQADGAQPLGEKMSAVVVADWIRYFYPGLPAAEYPGTVLPGGGRGALTAVGEYHRFKVREHLEEFRKDHLEKCLERLRDLKAELKIPVSSSDEIEACMRQSSLQALSPTQWKASEGESSWPDHLARSLLYRVADSASRLTRRTENELGRVTFRNFTGSAAARFKETRARAGVGALHGHIEGKLGEHVGEVDRKLRRFLGPVQDAMRAAQRSMDELKGEMDPVAIGEIEAVLQVIQRGGFYPTLILPQMAWSYQDVFPEKYYPRASMMRVPLNDRHELDPMALLTRLEEMRYLFRRFPEIFELFCKSMLLLVNSPNNPTGVVYRRETVLRLLQIASEYGITVCDDNAYHRVITKRQKAREGEDCIAEIYEKYREHFPRPVRILTATATTKGLQGSGDRTGFVHSNVPEAVEYARRHASAPHLMSLYLTQLKLEVGLASKRCTKQLETLAAELLDPAVTPHPWDRVKEMLEREIAQAQDERCPTPVLKTLLEGYEELLRLKHRDAGVQHYSESVSRLSKRLKTLRLERRMREDVDRRFEKMRAARAAALPGMEYIEPEGAFYACVRLDPQADDRGMQEFLMAMSRYRKIDMSYAGHGYVRLSLGGRLDGDEKSYDRYGKVMELFMTLVKRTWDQYEAAGRDPSKLPEILRGDAKDPYEAALVDLAPLFELHPQKKAAQGLCIEPSERGMVFCIEEGRSVADKVFVGAGHCANVEELLRSRPFRVVYRRLLKKVFRRHPAFTDMAFERVENQYGPLACLAAYKDRQLIDEVFRQLLKLLYAEWHGESTIKVLHSPLSASKHSEKIASLHGISRQINDLINELMHAFAIPESEVTETSSFEVGYEELGRVRANPVLPPYLRRIIETSSFAGATASLDPAPKIVTGAAKRVADVRYGFIRRDGDGVTKPDIEHFRRRLESFAENTDFSNFVCKAEQVGPFKMLTMIHKACFHLISDELRLFPQIEAVQLKENVDRMDWDGVMLFGIPNKFMGDAYKTGYVLDHKADGSLLPTAWVAREDATDYVGFFKKTLLTLHNEQVKARGGMPVHGAMIIITFKNGLRKTLVLSADSGAGKSEMITAMMEQMVNAQGLAAEVDRIDILAGDMLSLWRGEDGQVYAFGTETGDFLRLTDITENWKKRFGDLLKRGNYSNLDHPKNPRVTIPGICDAKKLLSPTRVNGFFYMNNYAPAVGSAVEVSNDPHHSLKHVLVRGLRKNKGTSGDPPNLRAGLEIGGEVGLVTRFRHAIDELLEWQERNVGGKTLTCLVYRDGASDVFQAREMMTAAFVGRSFELGGEKRTIARVEHDVVENLFLLDCGSGVKPPLHRAIYDQIYEPVVSTFCGNPFVEPEGMDRTLEIFAETMRQAKVHTGTIKTQLAREGYEHLGPARAARDAIAFLLEDEEVNARFQRNKEKVHQAMQRTYGGVLEVGSNLPVELEGYNLLLLEAHESTHVKFRDHAEGLFTLSTPFYHYQEGRETEHRTFTPAIALPEMVATIADICGNANHDHDLGSLVAELSDFDSIRHWNSREELVYQVLLVNGVIDIGSSETEIARFPAEVRKANDVAERILKVRQPEFAPAPAMLKAV